MVKVPGKGRKEWPVVAIARGFTPLGSESGIALVIVLWAFALLMIVTTGFVYAIRAESYGTANFRDGVRAYYLAYSGISAAVAEISRPYDIVYTDGSGRTLLGRKGPEGIEAVTTEREFSLGGGSVSYAIEDELGKINLNSSSREALAGLLASSGVDVVERGAILDSVMDWTDENHEFRMNGAEDDHYMALRDPYQAKDGPFDTPEELLLVKGVTRELFYGRGKEPGSDGGEAEAGAGDGIDTGISPYVTVWGNGRINLNTAGFRVLKAAFGEGKAIEIMLRRETEGYLLRPVHGGAVTSGVFSVNSTGEWGGMKVGIRAVVERDVAGGVKIKYWNEEGVKPL